jgi:hypothetical protein
MPSSNIIVSYDLDDDHENLRGNVEKRIEEAGDAERVNNTVWFVKSELTSKEVKDRVWAAMSGDDSRVFVVNASTNDFDCEGVDFTTKGFVKKEWCF